MAPAVEKVACEQALYQKLQQTHTDSPLCRQSGLAAQTLGTARTFSSSYIYTLKMLDFNNVILFMSFKKNVWLSTTRLSLM